MQQKAQNHEL